MVVYVCLIQQRHKVSVNKTTSMCTSVTMATGGATHQYDGVEQEHGVLQEVAAACEPHLVGLQHKQWT